MAKCGMSKSGKVKSLFCRQKWVQRNEGISLGCDADRRKFVLE
jgi:hypothetical protein